MRSRKRRFAAVASLVLAGGFLMAGPGTSCLSFVGESAFVSTDFCFIFDCQNGFLGGSIRPCAGQGSGNQTFQNDDLPLFADCPNGP